MMTNFYRKYRLYLGCGCLCLLIHLTAFAQIPPPPFGKIVPADFFVASDWQKAEPAVQLIKTGFFKYEGGKQNDLRTRQTRRFRIKITNAQGLAQANIRLPYFSKDNVESIQNVRANTYRLTANGKVVTTALASNAIFKQKINNRNSALVFSLPNVQPGCIIEYQYDLVRENMWEIDDWYFQDELPTLFCQYHLQVPQFIEYSSQAFRSLPMEVKEKVTDEVIELGDGFTDNKRFRFGALNKYFTMQHIPALRQEPFMYGMQDYLQRIKFQINAYKQGQIKTKIRNTWKDLQEELLNDPDGLLQLEEPLQAILPDSLFGKSVFSSLDSIKAIFQYLQQNWHFSGSFDIWCDEGISRTWLIKKGNSADINLLLIALLQQVGIPAKPLLVSSRQHGMVYKNYPYIHQFNNVLAYIKVGEKVLVLDATDADQLYYLYPEQYLNTDGYLVSDAKAESWVSLMDETYPFRFDVVVDAKMDDQLRLKGNCNAYLHHYAKSSDTVTATRFFSEVAVGANSFTFGKPVANIATTDANPNDYSVGMEIPLNETGSLISFPANWIAELSQQPFDAANRFADIDFGYMRQFQQTINYSMPDQFEWIALPEALKFYSADSACWFKRTVQSINSTAVTIRTVVHFDRSYFAADEYADVKKFYQQLQQAIRQPIAARKK